VNHTVAIWQNLHARFTEHTGLAAPPVAVLSALMRKSKKQVPQYLASLQAGDPCCAEYGNTRRGA
jgi:hypothetical protein